MDRRQRRQEYFQIVKELNRLKQDKVYLNTLKDEEFAAIVKKDLELLKQGSHPDKNIQFRYGKAINCLSQILQFEERLKWLHHGFREKSKEDIPTV
jgi:phosphoglycerate-specific signal transduction histidine kinase